MLIPNFLQKLPILNAISEESFHRRNKSSSALDLRESTTPKLEPLQPLPEHQSTPNIKPGELSPEIVQILNGAAPEEEKDCDPILCRAIETLSQCREEEPKNAVEMIEEKIKNKHVGILMNDYSNFQVAKRFHDENLKHQPLPDVVDDPVFKALASNKDPYPGKALNVQPNASAIGWKPSGAPGPTKCSKVKVYRPKTSLEKSKSMGKIDTRPKTCDPKKDKNFGPIDLAICWDLAPEEKPRRSLHIDGSGGGEAPSVFAVVRPEEREICVAGSPQAVATHVATSVDENNVGTLPPKIGQKVDPNPKRVTNRSAIMAQVKPVNDSPAPSYHSLSPESAEVARNHPKTAWTNHDTSKELSERLKELEETSRKQGNTPISRTKSTPNLAPKKCEGSNCGTESSTDKKSYKEHKMAFKAGMPQIGHTPQPQPTKSVKMPKMRPPYAKKNYAISTLIPPFSLWPDHHGQEYPEHWRLASVYQHSYKPVDKIRKPLLASVYQ